MKRSFKIFVCAVLITALSFFTFIDCFAVSSDYVYNKRFGGVGSPSLDFVQLSSTGEESKISDGELTNKGSGSFNFVDYGLNIPDGDNLLCYPAVYEPFYKFSSPYTAGGFARVGKRWTPYDLGYIGAYCISFEFCVAFGLQKVSAGTPEFKIKDEPTVLLGDEATLLLGSEVGSVELVHSVENTEITLSTTDGDIPFFVSLYKYKFTFDEPFDLSSLGTEQVLVQCSYSWEGLPIYYLRTFSAFSPFNISYVTSDNLTDYNQSIVIDGNNDINNSGSTDISNAKDDINSVIDDVPGDVFKELLFNVSLGDMEEFGDSVSFEKNVGKNTTLYRVISLSMTSVLAIALCGYVLHGKRG